MVGRSIELDGQPVTVVGVVPASADYPEVGRRRDVWALKVFRPDEREDRVADYRQVVARLRPEVALAEAQAEMDGIASRLAVEYPRTNARSGVGVVPLREQIVGPVRPALFLLLGAVLLLLAIACFNVAGLLLARGAERQAEIAVRGALGAGRGRLGRQLVTESLLLALAGGALGVALARLALPVMARMLPPELPRAATVALDGRVLAFAVALTAAAGVLAGLAPALRLSRPDFGALLTAGARAGEDRGRVRLRGGLVVAEIALALVLLVASGLLLRSFGRLLTNDLGFDPEGRVALQLFLWDHNPTDAARAQRVGELVERFAALPGVEDVGVVSALPFHPHAIDVEADVRVEGRREADTAASASAFATVATPGYFPAMDIPLLDGRLLAAADRAGGPRVAVINRTLARRLFPAGDPLGERLVVGNDGGLGTWEVVGVVGDVRSKGLDSEPRPELFVPFDQSRTGSVTFVIEADTDDAATLARAQQIVWQVDPDQTVYHSATLEELVATTLAERRFHLALFTAFSTMALLLAALGIFGLVSFSTRQRTREFGIRLALGAAPGNVVRAALRQGVGLGLPGVALGTLGALLASRSLTPLLYGVTPTDPGTFLPVAGLMLAVALAGAWLPGRRVSRLHPAAALREP
jgi:predicted permease